MRVTWWSVALISDSYTGEHTETLGNWLHRKPVPVQSTTALCCSQIRTVRMPVRYTRVHIYRYIYSTVVWSRYYCRKYDITLSNIANDGMYRLFHVWRVNNQVVANTWIMRRVNFENLPKISLFNRSIVVLIWLSQRKFCTPGGHNGEANRRNTSVWYHVCVCV